MRTIIFDGQRVGYAITHVTLVGKDEWEEVSSIDTNHGCVHLHNGAKHERIKDVKPVYSQVDVQSSFNDSYDLIYDGYEQFKDKL